MTLESPSRSQFRTVSFVPRDLFTYIRPCPDCSHPCRLLRLYFDQWVRMLLSNGGEYHISYLNGYLDNRILAHNSDNIPIVTNLRSIASAPLCRMLLSCKVLHAQSQLTNFQYKDRQTRALPKRALSCLPWRHRTFELPTTTNQNTNGYQAYKLLASMWCVLLLHARCQPVAEPQGIYIDSELLKGESCPDTSYVSRDFAD